MLNSSRLTQFDNDLGIFPVCSWLYLRPSLERRVRLPVNNDNNNYNKNNNNNNNNNEVTNLRRKVQQLVVLQVKLAKLPTFCKISKNVNQIMINVKFKTFPKPLIRRQNIIDESGHIAL